MKRPTIINSVLITASAALVLCFQSGCGKDAQNTNPLSDPSFTVKYMLVSGIKEKVIELNNGLIVRWNATNIDILFGKTNGGILTAIIDPTNSQARMIMRTITDLDGTPSQFVFDTNADGIPEKRSFYSRPVPEYFYKGAWYPKDTNANGAIGIRVNGKLTLLRHDGVYWNEVSPEP